MIGIGRWISMIGILILSAGLLCHGLEAISDTAFRVITLIGIIVQITALVFILKKKEF